MVSSLRVQASASALEIELHSERLNQNLSLEKWSLESCIDVVRDAVGVTLKVKVQD